MFYFELSKSQIHVNIFPQYIWIKLWPHTHNQVFPPLWNIYLMKMETQWNTYTQRSFYANWKNWVHRKYQNKNILLHKLERIGQVEKIKTGRLLHKTKNQKLEEEKSLNISSYKIFLYWADLCPASCKGGFRDQDMKWSLL